MSHMGNWKSKSESESTVASSSKTAEAKISTQAKDDDDNDMEDQKSFKAKILTPAEDDDDDDDDVSEDDDDTDDDNTEDERSAAVLPSSSLLHTEPIHRRLEPEPLTKPVLPHMVRFICISDTHHYGSDALRGKVPEGDVLLHCGDFTNRGLFEEVEKFNNFLGELPHRYKIVIAGNHELTFDEKIFPMAGKVKDHTRLSSERMESNREYLISHGKKHMSQLLTNCTYLQDSETTVFGLRVYGSPWQPEFCQWAFNLRSRRELREKWQKIPNGIDVLMTHGPPFGRGDCTVQGIMAGCQDLLAAIQQKVQPKFHVYGHIHEGREQELNSDAGLSTDGTTVYINASLLNRSYQLVFDPVIFDLPLPPGTTKIPLEGDSSMVSQQ